MSKKKQRNPKIRPLKPTSTSIGFYPILIIVILISSIGLINNYQKNKQQISPQATQEVATEQTWKKVIQPNIAFASQTYQDHAITHVLIPLKFGTYPQTVWLIINGNSPTQPNPILMTHPQLMNLTWKAIDDGIIHLYQRQKTYKSMEDFIDNPPDPEKIAIDLGVQKIEKYNSVVGKELDETIDSNSVDYILTTFVPPKSNNDVYYYENTFDTSQVILDKDNKILWQMNAPEATETNPLYIGHINIDYQ